MNTGTALFNGDRVYFSDTIYNNWTDELEHLIAYNGETFWVKNHQLHGVQYNIITIKRA